MLGLLVLTTFLATDAVPPATQPSTRPAPDWIEDPTGCTAFEGIEDFALKTAPAHVKRWHEYRRLEVTPVTDDEAFLSKLAMTLAREAVFVPDVPPYEEEGSGRVPTTRPSAPDGPMDDARFASLAKAVHEAWIVLQDRPFDEQRHRYFRGRVARLDYPDLDAATIEHSLGERVDPARLEEAEIWDYLERMYVKRVTAYDGAFNLRAAALDSPRGIACQIFYVEPMGLNDGLLLAIGNPTGSGWDDYWRAGLIVCARQFTHPPVSSLEVRERDGRVLHADVQTILEMNNGERAPMLLSLFYDPQEERWWVTSCCFSSSPFLGEVGHAR